MQICDKKKKKLVEITSALILFDVFFNIPFAQAQMFFLKCLPISNRVIMALILLLIALDFYFLPIFKNRNRLINIITVLLLEVFLVLPLVSLINTGSLANWFFIASKDNFFLFFSLFFVVFRDQLDFKKILSAIFYIGLLNCAICLLQYRFDSILYPFYLYPDGEWIYNSIDFYSSARHTFRSVGTLNSGYDCGILLNYSIVYALYELMHHKKTVERAVYLAVICLLLFSVYTTFTRNIYLMTIFLAGMFALSVLPFPKKLVDFFYRYLSLILFSLFFLFFICSPFLQIGTSPNGLLSTVSLSMRFDEWALALRTFVSHPLQLIIGFAESQCMGLLNDNIYINTVYSSGLIGLALYGCLWFGLTDELYHASKYQTPFFYFYVYTCTIFVVGVGNLICSIYALLALSLPLAILMREKDLLRKARHLSQRTTPEKDAVLLTFSK